LKTRKYKIAKIIDVIIYYFLIFFFCYTASNKLLNIESFGINLIKTSLFDITGARYFSILVIVWEILVVSLLLFYKKIGVLFFLATILIFTIYISYLKFRGLYEVCGCGGILNGLEYKYHLIINLMLIIVSFYCFILKYFKE
jgi:hypothetical protein